MIAIHTKYLCPTNSRGSRIKAYTCNGMGFKGFTTTIPYPHELSGEACHFEAVKALIRNNKLDWDTSNMRYGDSADGRGFCFCFENSIVRQ